MSDAYVLGYALAAQGKPPMASTVAATERAAMVNALVAVYGVMAYDRESDAEIKKKFERCKSYGHEIVGVQIRRLPVMPKGE